MESNPILTDADFRRARIRDQVTGAIRSAFPFVGKKYTLDVDNIRVSPETYTPVEHKRALMQARTLAEPVHGDLILKDKAGTVIEKVPDFSLLRLPFYTNHGTFVLNGSTYSVSNQLRMKPGVYTRKRKNEELEAGFNLAKGDNFRLSMDPETGHFKMEYGATRIPLYPVLRSLGVSDATISKHWNRDVTATNREAFAKKTDQAIGKLYDHLVPAFAQLPGDDKIAAIKASYASTSMDPEINRRTLGHGYDKVSPEALLAASGKLLKAYSNEADFDERDSLAFKKLMTVDDFLKERIQLDARDIKRKVMGRLEGSGGRPDLRRAVPIAPFTKSIHRFLSTSQLSNNPDQINPVEMMDSIVRVTSMGEGGIENIRAIPQEARRLHTSQAGIFDPMRTPENDRVGIDIRTTLFSGKDENGDLYFPIRNIKKGKVENLSIAHLIDHVIAFPGQDLKKQKWIDAIKNNQVVAVRPSEVEYQIPVNQSLFSPSSSLVPFLESIDGNRGTMASKMQTQALSLEESDVPLIQIRSHLPGRTMHELIGDLATPKSKVAGTVKKIKDGVIYIQPDGKTAAAGDEGLARAYYYENFPLASKTYLDQKLRVAVGDHVEAHQQLADDSHVKDGSIALGRNLNVAYIPLRGMNSNDAIAVSQSAAAKLTSLHMYKKGLDVEKDMTAAREAHKTYFGNMYTKAMYEQLDRDGLVKPGVTVNKGDILVAAMRKSTLTPEAAMLGRLHKSLVKPFRDSAVVWDHDAPGEVTDVIKTGGKIRMTVKTKEPLHIGDKLSGLYGNKGVVSTIIPDDQMLKDEAGNTIDVALTPAGIVSRINPAQILEVAVGKVARKLGHPIIIDNFAEHDNVQFAKDLLKKHDVKDKETVFDPATGKSIPGVLTGPAYVLKLFKSTETNYSARGVEDYDVNQQPSGGGPEGAKALGGLEVNALLAHGAKSILREASTLKGQRNDEFWRAYQLGLPLPQPKTSFVYDKFGAMLAGAGVKINKSDRHLRLAPLTDKEIDRMAKGVVKEPLFVRAKDLRPETGGLFDPAATGGTTGTKWSKYELAEPVVNPIFEKPVQALLGMTAKEFARAVREDGAGAIKKRLAKLDVAEEYKSTRSKLDTARTNERDPLIKRMKYLEGLRIADVGPADAYVLSRLAVVPPVFRPIIPGKGGDLQVSDANYLYRDVMLADDLLRKSHKLPEAMQQDARKHLYDSTKALFGLGEPVSPQAKGRNAQGFIAYLTGGGRTPKAGFFQAKMLRKTQDVSGRGTIVPDATLGMDEVGIPEDMGWKMYKPFVVRRMVGQGYKALDARDRVDKQDPTARGFLQQEIKERPVLINRAPSLRRYNVLAAYPKLVPGKSVRIHELFAPIQAGDFDGDSVQLHLPVLPDAVDEAKKLTLSSMLLGDQFKMQTTVTPQHEATAALYRATSAKAEGKMRKFKTRTDAMEAYHKGEITLSTPVEIG